MKKIVMILLGIAATINVMAVDYTAKAIVTLESESGYTCQLTIRQATAYGALNGAEMNMEGRHVAFYALNGTQPLQIAQAADMDGVKIGLLGDGSASYTITVSNVVGSEILYIWDADTASYPLVAGESYTFAPSANTTDEARFVIKKAPLTAYNVTLNAEGLATFSAPKAVEIPAGLKAYKAQYVSMTDYLTLGEITGNIPANTGVILYGDANANYELSITDAAVAALSGNDLKPATEWVNHSGTIYILHGDELWEYTGSNFAPNKAYLELPVSAPAPKRIRLVFDQATAIDNVEVEAIKAEKFVENGQIFIRRGNEVFNLQGQIVK